MNICLIKINNDKMKLHLLNVFLYKSLNLHTNMKCQKQ